MSRYIDAERAERNGWYLQRNVTYSTAESGYGYVETMRPTDYPAADAQEVRHGRWEHYAHIEPQYDINGVKTWGEAYQCSNCGFIHSVIEDFGHYAFCPNCGAKMVNEDDNTD